MQYQDGVIKLVGPKTRNAKRTMYINDVLKVHLQTLKDRHELAHREMRAKREQNQRFIKDIDGAVISSLELVNSLIGSREIRIKVLERFPYLLEYKF